MDGIFSAGLIGAAAVLMSVGTASSTARAEEWAVRDYISDQYDGVTPRTIRVAPPPPQGTFYPPADGPAVFGWIAVRPASCGQYRYWDGTQCLDARDNPPDVGPRW